MKSGIEYYNEFKARQEKYSDKELIEAFNGQVNINAWGTARASYLSAIHKEFDDRNFDYSSIGDESSLSFKNKISIQGKTIFINE